MAPLIALVAAFAVFRSLGFYVPYFAENRHALRGALGVMFLLTASAHWGRRRAELICMVPGNVSNPAGLVSLTGLAIQIVFIAALITSI